MKIRLLLQLALVSVLSARMLATVLCEPRMRESLAYAKNISVCYNENMRILARHLRNRVASIYSSLNQTGSSTVLPDVVQSGVCSRGPLVPFP